MKDLYYRLGIRGSEDIASIRAAISRIRTSGRPDVAERKRTVWQPNTSCSTRTGVRCMTGTTLA